MLMLYLCFYSLLNHQLLNISLLYIVLDLGICEYLSNRLWAQNSQAFNIKIGSELFIRKLCTAVR